ncbi:glucose dehydrogenase [FAD, quinone]-like [Phymastichus coffea]|uniref:glucose dehydrogenase [FAD, quinone]-like n=1 Tax=Phymastichus coffea TaxID=108790 RepID=UPI00273C8561|nr:glucose dehydrogenase [FAD, quinone]-like [Phymastichus coffea]
MNVGLKDITPTLDEEYDFVVIGAGSAGATIASRLSEVPDVRVLLIEAGRNENYMMDIPLIVNYLQFSDEVNWKFQTESSETYCLDEHWTNMFASISGNHSWTIFPMLMRPNSRGRILLRNNDPNSKPKIFANYFDDPEDVRVMVKGIRAAIEVSRTDAMQRFKSELYNFAVPGCEKYEYDSDEYWECAARTFTFTIYHQSGTCKMAPNSDPTGVVNSRLQVRGIKGLRVADASIMPMIMTGHTNIPVIMIGEKLADMVKEDWKLYSNENKP